MSTESNFNDFAIKILKKYNVKITINLDLQENRGYVFTPSTIDASPRECVLFQLAIKFMVDALDRHCEYIHLFD